MTSEDPCNDVALERESDPSNNTEINPVATGEVAVVGEVGDDGEAEAPNVAPDVVDGSAVTEPGSVGDVD